MTSEEYWQYPEDNLPFNGNDVLIVMEFKDINGNAFYDKGFGNYENGQWYYHEEGRISPPTLWMYIPDYPWELA